mmetsp:Transcript_41450/g.63849  ORF Transcript_41450/g.63849 Transcript_41450/m.63849 type:complete len:152 (-) Transcript_41450:112-567(-)
MLLLSLNSFRNMRTNRSSERTSTQAARYEERVLLNEFVRTHYTVTGDGEIAFECKCQHPGNCSILQHHPDVDALIVEMGVLYEPDPVHQRKQSPDYFLGLGFEFLFVFVCIVQYPNLQRSLGTLGFLIAIILCQIILFSAFILPAARQKED